MKKTVICFSLFAATFMAACSGSGQKEEVFLEEGQVPVAVRDAFKSKYPAATDVKWEKETEGSKVEYEIGFKMDGNGKEAFFKEDGAFVREEE